MSFWIHAFCNESVASVTPDELAAGIAKRLTLLTYLFCPPNEEEPAEVLQRMRIENTTQDGVFQAFLIRYRADSPTFIRADRYVDRGGIAELDEALASRSEPVLPDIRQRLAKAKEDVAFCLKAADVDGMGFPLAIAAAACLVEKAGGFIQSGTYSWMVPDRKEVRIIAEFER